LDKTVDFETPISNKNYISINFYYEKVSAFSIVISENNKVLYINTKILTPYVVSRSLFFIAEDINNKELILFDEELLNKWNYIQLLKNKETLESKRILRIYDYAVFLKEVEEQGFPLSRVNKMNKLFFENTRKKGKAGLLHLMKSVWNFLVKHPIPDDFIPSKDYEPENCIHHTLKVFQKNKKN
jgi:hypothetical protein